MKKQQIYLIFTALYLFTLPLFAQNNPEHFIKQVSDFYQSKNAISYDISYKIKTFDDNDTIFLSGNCAIVRDVKDTIYGAKFWVDVKHSQEVYCKYYNAQNFYLIEDSLKKITRFESIGGSFDNDFINTRFLTAGGIYSYISDQIYKYAIKDTVFKKKNFTALILKIKNEDNEESTLSIFINKKNKTIEKITYYAPLKDQHQYNEWNLSNIKFNGYTAAALEKKFKPYTLKYPIEVYKEPTEEEMAPLKDDTVAPGFSAKLYGPENSEIKLSDFKGKIVLLDFWYIGCGYCSMAIPYLSSIQNKFKDKVVVLGVNPLDNNEKNLKKMPDYIKRNNPAYPLAFIDSSVSKAYNIWGYPTFYIIGKDGTIKKTYIGYDKNYEQELEQILTHLINEN